MRQILSSFTIQLPDELADWVARRAVHSYPGEEERMRFVLELLTEANRTHQPTPFAAAVFSGRSGRLVSVGVNLKGVHHTPFLHAPQVALAMAHELDQNRCLDRGYELFLSCEPCDSCCICIAESGVKVVRASASNATAAKQGFELGRGGSYGRQLLTSAGVDFQGGLLASESQRLMREGTGH